jgi:hypothetical protein|tara:strand:- start:1465 stop:1737 length:273 start_codon:yes stop_codon:yes gene_type:complete
MDVVTLTQPNEEEQSGMSEEELVSRLIAMGVNAASSSYDNADKEIYTGFLALPLKSKASLWLHLNDRVRLALLTSHHDEFMTWIDGVSDE